MLCYIELCVGMIPLTPRQNRQWAYHGTKTYYPVNGERQRLNNERYRGPSLCAIVMQIIRGETSFFVYHDPKVRQHVRIDYAFQ